jgi:hypothetical protein
LPGSETGYVSVEDTARLIQRLVPERSFTKVAASSTRHRHAHRARAADTVGCLTLMAKEIVPPIKEHRQQPKAAQNAAA